MGKNRVSRRRCVASGEVLSTDRLVRFVVGPDGEIVPDIEAALPGRGLWVTASANAMERATDKDLFSKAARCKVRIPDHLAARVTARLVVRCQSLLGLARRAGTLTVGFEKVRAQIDAGNATVLVQAADASPHGTAKLDRLAAALDRVTILTREELSLAVGRENVVHAALARGRLANRFVIDAARLVGLRGGDTPPETLLVSVTDEYGTRSLIENAEL